MSSRAPDQRLAAKELREWARQARNFLNLMHEAHVLADEDTFERCQRRGHPAARSREVWAQRHAETQGLKEEHNIEWRNMQDMMPVETLVCILPWFLPAVDALRLFVFFSSCAC